MNEKLEKIEKGYRIPCGPVDVAADAICRRSLKDGTNYLLDRLTKETNPEVPKASKLPDGLETDEEGKVVGKKGESVEERKLRLIEEGKLRAEVQEEVRKYKEEVLQGNSKLLQDITGKIEPR